MENPINNNYNNKRLFSFYIINKFVILPFLMPILSEIGNYLLNLIHDNYKLNNNEYLSSVFISSSLIGGGLSYFLFLCKINDKNILEINENEIKIELIDNDRLKKNNKKIFLILIIMSLIFSICNFFGYYISVNYVTFEKKLYTIIFIAFSSKYILKSEFYLHHKFFFIIFFKTIIIN